MAKPPPSKNQTSKPDATDKADENSKPGSAPTDKPSKPPFTKKVSDLDLED